MAYRILRATLGAFVDSSQTAPLFGPLDIAISQPKDRKVVSKAILIGPTDAEAAIDLTPLTTGYFWALVADYPVKYRLNGSSATQHTMHTNNTAAVNAGSPLPPQCFACGTSEVTSIRLEPIGSAAQTATVLLLVTGDPLNAYT